MNGRTHRNHSSKAQARIARVKDKRQKLRDRVRRSSVMLLEHSQARLTWWQQAFCRPMSAGRWVFSESHTLWSAFLALLNLAPSDRARLLARRSDIHGNRARKSARRNHLILEGLEQRQLLAADLTLIDINASGAPVYDASVVIGGNLYYGDSDAQNGYELHALNLTTNTTSLVADINPGLGDSYAGQYGGFTAVGSKLYFSALDPTHGIELRVLDTTNNTFTTVDINSGGNSSEAGEYGGFTAVGSQLYFRAYDPTHGTELRVLDTTNNTFTTLDINSGSGGSFADYYSGFTAVGDKLYFSADDPTYGLELRVLDTANNTFTTVDISSGSGDSYAGELGGFTAVGNRLYFSASTAGFGRELFSLSIAAPV